MTHIDDFNKLLQDIEDKLSALDDLAPLPDTKGATKEVVAHKLERPDLSVVVRDIQAKLGILQDVTPLAPHVGKVQKVKIK